MKLPRWLSRNKRSGGRNFKRSSQRPSRRGNWSGRQHHDGVAWFAQIDRVNVLRFGFLTFGVVIILRLFVVQVVQGSEYKALAFDTHELFQELIPERGEILVHDQFTTNGTVPIATNKVLSEVHAEPIHITDPDATAAALAPLLNIPKKDLLEKIDKPGDPDEILKRRVPAEVVRAIEDLNLVGIKFRDEQWRYYPEGEYAAHLTGYFGYSDTDRTGQYGLEGYFEDDLKGTAGYIEGEKDALGRFLTIGDSVIAKAKDGVDLVLTIDKNVQFYVCDRLKAEVDRLGAKEGTIIIMEPNSGAVIAMCNYPSFDPNAYNEVESIDVFVNSAVSDAYEPGSVFKPITMAAGLDSGTITPSTTYTDPGARDVCGFKVTNFDGKTYGTKTMTEVLQNSLNTGTMFAVDQMGSDVFNDYVHRFGFGKETGVELSGETAADITPLETVSECYTLPGSYGHGFTVSPLQLVTAYAAIANGGQLMKPYVVDRYLHPSGVETITEPQVVQTVISPSTATTLAAMLVSVIDSGHAKRAAVPGYFLAGKTGTALVVGSNGKYDRNRHNDTFAGFGPVSDPKFVMLIKMNEPHSEYAEGSVVPLWGELAQYLLNYYQVPPDRE
jgi:cell division protein FtsI/penicillin-binding protein 2